MQLNTKINFSSFKSENDTIYNYILKTKILPPDSSHLKKNIFLNTTLFFSSYKNHELKVTKKQLHMEEYLQDEILWVLMALFPNLDHSLESNPGITINRDDSLIEALGKLSKILSFDPTLYAYKKCIIKNFSFRFLTKEVINFQLKPLLKTLSVDDVIQLIPVQECTEITGHTFRFLQKKNTLLQTDEITSILNECLEI